MRVAEEREEDPREIEIEEQRLEFYAAIEQARERWFGLEAEYRRTGNAEPLHNIIEQIRNLHVQRVDAEVER